MPRVPLQPGGPLRAVTFVHRCGSALNANFHSIVRSGYNNAELSEKWVQMPAAYPRAMAHVHLRWEKNV